MDVDMRKLMRLLNRLQPLVELFRRANRRGQSTAFRGKVPIQGDNERLLTLRDTVQAK